MNEPINGKTKEGQHCDHNLNIDLFIFKFFLTLSRESTVFEMIT
jgi:hypothetical protein